MLRPKDGAAKKFDLIYREFSFVHSSTDWSLELTGSDIYIFGDIGVFEARSTRRKVVKIASSH